MHGGDQSTAEGAIPALGEATSGAGAVYSNVPPYPSSDGAPRTVKLVLTPLIGVP